MKKIALGLALSALAVTGTLAVQTPALSDPPTVCWNDDTNDQRTTDSIEFPDFLSGTDDGDIAALGAGDDQYYAAGGPDELCGNEGNDVLVGEAGADKLDGGPDDDTLQGMGGADTLRGREGKDELRGGGGDDSLSTTFVDDVQDDIYDGAGSDTISGNSEDIWHRCDDDTPDPHDNFEGITVPDVDCP